MKNSIFMLVKYHHEQMRCALNWHAFVWNNFPAAHLFALHDRLLSGCRGNNSPVAPWTELQGQREPRHQLHSELCHTHFIIHHPDAHLSQDRWRQRGQHLQQVPAKDEYCTMLTPHSHKHSKWLTCTVVVPTALPCSSTPSCTLATSGSAMFRE